jgi:hypothetical protein
MNKQEIEENAAAVIANAEDQADPKEKFCSIWKGTVKPALRLIKIVTGEKMDVRIDNLIRSADLVCDGNHPDMSNYCEVWSKYKIKQVLTILKKITGKKTDKAIDIFINISESFCPVA